VYADVKYLFNNMQHFRWFQEKVSMLTNTSTTNQAVRLQLIDTPSTTFAHWTYGSQQVTFNINPSANAAEGSPSIVQLAEATI